MMKFTLLILSGMLPMAGCSSCYFSDGRTDWYGYQYTFNCIKLAEIPGELSGDQRLAICLLQRNSIRRMLECGFWDGQKMFTESVTIGSTADRLQLTRDLPWVKGFNDDGLVKVTPKDVLLTVAELDLCEENCGVARPIRKCPYFNKQQFTACLCCEGVETSDFDCLNRCLGTFGAVVHPDNWISPNFKCIGSCPYGPVVSRFLIVFSPSHFELQSKYARLGTKLTRRDVSHKQVNFKRSSQYSACQWHYKVKNGIWQENRCLPVEGQLAENDWDDDPDGEILTLTATTYSTVLQIPTETPSSTAYTFSTSALFSTGLSTGSAENSQRNFDTTSYAGATATTTYIASTAAGSLLYGCWTSVFAAVYAYLFVWLQ